MTIQEAKAKYEHRLLEIKGVIAVGIGVRKDQTQVIIVGLDRERPKSIRRIPQFLEGYPVEIQVIGSVRAG